MTGCPEPTGVSVAERGLFPTAYSSHVSSFSQAPYQIRRATNADLARLAHLETFWAQGLACSVEQISSRLQNFPSGQWVATVDNKVVGAMFTQRISSISSLAGTLWTGHPSLHHDEGATLQLLGVVVDPAYSQFQLGKVLRDVVVYNGRMDATITDIVAMTRCSAFQGTTQAEHDEHVGTLSDPGIQFHLLAGAELVRIARGYRATDVSNLGNAVLIRYSATYTDKRVKPEPETQKEVNKRITQPKVSAATLRDLVASVSQKAGRAFSVDSSFMAFGLDSLQMVELGNKLQSLTEVPLPPTLLFNHPTPKSLVDYLNNTHGSTSIPAFCPPAADDADLIAVVGMSCRLPGSSNNPAQFWEHISTGADGTQPVPDAWDKELGGAVSRAAFLDDDAASAFDPERFHMSKAEASSVDPHQRLLLSLAEEALVDSDQLSHDKQNTAVFVGLSNNEWVRSQSLAPVKAYSSTSTSQAIAANRISYTFDLGGQSTVVDTACSSGLMAVHAACSSLRAGDCSSALVAAADLMISPYSLRMRCASGMLAPDGRCKTFSENADGYARGEGGAAVVLTSLSRARKLGRRVLCVIRGSAANQDGQSASLTAPNGTAQARLIRRALERARVSPEHVRYVETHGTGTPLGDPIEVRSICEVLGANREKDNPLALGALKTSIGHLEGAAGLAGFVKTVMVLQHRQAPPNLNCSNTNPLVQAAAEEFSTPLQLLSGTSLSTLAPAKGTDKLIASTSSFGSGGTNVHVVLEATPDGIAMDDKSPSKSSKLAFLFSGQGSQYPGMCARLFKEERVFADAIRDCADLMADESAWVQLLDLLQDEDDDDDPEQHRIHQTQYSQPAIFAVEYALAKLWESRGLKPDAVAGHSIGEFAAACVAGVMSLADAAKLVVHRGRFMAKADHGIMVAVRASEEDVHSAFAATQVGPRASLAAVNGPCSVVISGEPAAVNAVVAHLARSHKQLRVSHAFHSPSMASASEEFRAIVSTVTLSEPSIPLVCNLTGQVVPASTITSTDYWVQQITSPVRFGEMVQTLRTDLGCDVFLEVGPKPTLTRMAQACVADLRAARWFTSVSPADDDAMRHDERVARAISTNLPSSTSQPYPWRQDVVYPSGQSVEKEAAVDQDTLSFICSLARGSVFGQDQLTDAELAQSSLTRLGMDSISAIELRSTLLRTYGDFPGCPTPAELLGLTPTELSRVVAAGAQRGGEQTTEEVEAPFEGEHGTCSMQQGMIYHNLKDARLNEFLETFTWRLAGPVDRTLLEDAWAATIRAVPALRTTFDVYRTPEPVAHVRPAEDTRAPFTFVDCTDVEDIDGALDRFISNEREAGILDLSAGPLLRVALLKRSDHEHFMVLTIHHTIVDGWSMQILLNLLAAAYQGQVPSPLPSFKRFVDYETALAKEPALRHFSSVLDGFARADMTASGLPPLAVNVADTEVVRVRGHLAQSVVSDLRCYAIQEGITLSAILHMSWAILLSVYTESDDVVFGCTVSGRSAPFPDVDFLVGPMVNSLPVRARVDEDWKLLLRQLDQQLASALQNESCPLAAIQKACSNDAGALFNTIFDYQPRALETELGPELRVSEAVLLDRTGIPLSIRAIKESKGSIELIACSECAEYGQEFCKGLVADLAGVLTGIADLFGDGTAEKRFDLREHVTHFQSWAFKARQAYAEAKTALSSSSRVSLPPQLPSAPTKETDQPMVCMPVHRTAEQTASFEANCQRAGFSAEVALLTAFSLTLDRWSSTSSFRVVLCDSGDLAEIEANADRKDSFKANAANTYQELERAPVPQLAANSKYVLLRLVPDGHVMEPQESSPTLSCTITRNSSGAAVVQTQAHESILPSAVQAWNDTFTNLLNRLSSSSDCWDTTVRELLPEPPAIEPVTPVIPDPTELMHERFLKLATQADTQDFPAITQEGRTLSYREVYSLVMDVSRQLVAPVTACKSKGEEKYCVVAIVMQKGWQQVVAALSILQVQSVYLPMEASTWPEERVRKVLEMSKTTAILTQRCVVSERPWMSGLGLPVVVVDDASGSCDLRHDASCFSGLVRAVPGDLAYLIYTSGSTGTPKGVCCHHVGAMNTCRDLNERFGFSSEDRVLALSSLSFDLSVYDVFGVLGWGGCMVVPPADSVHPPDPERWLEMVAEDRVSLWNSVPAFMELLVSHAELMGARLPACLRLIFMSGDWIPLNLPARIRALSDAGDKLQIISMGGATEAAVWSNMFEIEDGPPAGWNSIPYGRPLGNQTMNILDENMERCETWVTGMIYIGGTGVAHGYYLDEARTAYQFVPHPVTGEALFRTGDLGRVRPGGILEILGREDSQVKINGFRIELGEVEEVLCKHEAVISAAIRVHKSSMYAFVILKDPALNDDEDRDQIKSELQKMCDRQLPDYMWPKSYTVVDDFPLSANGKVQRDKLELPEAEASSGCRPSTLTEEYVHQVWCITLDADSESFGIDDNFFRLGGDSIRALQMVSNARKVGLSISIASIHEGPTVREMAKLLAGSTMPSMLGSPLPGGKIFDVTHSPEAALTEPYPLFGINKAHWVGLHFTSFSEGLSPQIHFEWEWPDLDYDRLSGALAKLIARHPTLRKFVRQDGDAQLLPLEQCKYQIPHTPASECTPEHLASTRHEMMANGPNPSVWPLFEMRVSDLPPSYQPAKICNRQGTQAKRYSLVHFTVSLFLLDAMSDNIFRTELSQLYRNPDIELRPLSLFFRDYSIGMDELLPETRAYQEAKDYWFSRLQQLPDGPTLPTQKLGGTGKFKHAIDTYVSKDSWAVAKQNCAKYAVTPPAMLLACYAITLARFSTNKRFLLNVLQCQRHPVHPDYNSVIGNCSSTFLVVLDLSKLPFMSFADVVRHCGIELMRGLDTAAISGVEVMQELNRLRGSTFQAVAPFIFTTPIGVERNNPDTANKDWAFQERFFSERVPHTACVNAIKVNQAGAAVFGWDLVEGMFPDEVLEGLQRTYKQVLDLMCTKDSKMWSKAMSKVLPEPPAIEPVTPVIPDPTELMHERFLKLATQADTQDFPAITQEGRTLSYREVYSLVMDVSRQLVAPVTACKSKGEEKYCVVAIVMQKGWQQVVAALSVLQVQSVYLPMEASTWPEERVRKVLEMSKTTAILTQRCVVSERPWMSGLGLPVVVVDDASGSCDLRHDASCFSGLVRAVPGDLAYLIYTSGSTGTPKGVCCHHVGAMNTCRDLNERFGFSSEDRVLALSSLSFDLSVYDVFGVLGWGGCMVVPPADSVHPPDPERWLEMVAEDRVSLWNSVPAFMELLVSHAELMGARLPACLRLIFMSGDWIPLNLPARIRALSDAGDKLQIISMGGATEAAVWSNMFEIEDGPPAGWNSIPYGRPLGNQTMNILDENMERCETWVTGMIYIGGTGVAHGYYLDEARTAYQFVPHPVTGEALFRTGDLGRVRPGGILEILGREDSQVKINGFRIELGEVEEVLCKHEAVISAAIRVHKSSMYAFVILKDPALNDDEDRDQIKSELQKMCDRQLPDYMWPKSYTVVDDFPLSANGKVQRDRLPVPTTAPQRRRRSSVAFRAMSDKELAVLDMISHILDLSQDSVCCEQDSFFSLGGNSITALRLLMRLKKHFGQAPSISDLAAAPTVVGIVNAIERLEGKGALEAAPQLSLLQLHTNEPALRRLRGSDTFRKSSRASTGLRSSLNCIPDEDLPMQSPVTSPLNSPVPRGRRLRKSSRPDKLREGQHPPILFVHAAGASGLSYKEVAGLLPAGTRMWAVDDLSLTGAVPYSFDSIDRVALSCLKLIQASPEAFPPGPIVLGGWSYGGVVASKLALLLASSDSQHIVERLLMFDAPLVPEHQDAARQEEVYQTVRELTQASMGDDMDADTRTELVDGSVHHFKKCTELLNKNTYQTSQIKCTCPIVDARPRTHISSVKEDSILRDLTSGPVYRPRFEGDHWTMVQGENAAKTATLVSVELDDYLAHDLV